LPPIDLYLEMPRVGASFPFECRYAVLFGGAERRSRAVGEDGLQALELGLRMLQAETCYLLRGTPGAERFGFGPGLDLLDSDGNHCGSIERDEVENIPEPDTRG
jgi:hypothetical protein